MFHSANFMNFLCGKSAHIYSTTFFFCPTHRYGTVPDMAAANTSVPCVPSTGMLGKRPGSIFLDVLAARSSNSRENMRTMRSSFFLPTAAVKAINTPKPPNTLMPIKLNPSTILSRFFCVLTLYKPSVVPKKYLTPKKEPHLTSMLNFFDITKRTGAFCLANNCSCDGWMTSG
eukprot:Lithocolla_globosa_v1_NODE_982_length_2993_cov_6.794418.p2 type:complete len:173 gc:universal NODE_982_length_2993_cov_6.794418:1828-1310(-)